MDVMYIFWKSKFQANPGLVSHKFSSCFLLAPDSHYDKNDLQFFASCIDGVFSK